MHNQEVLQATLRLHKEVIPNFAKALSSEFDAAFTASEPKAVQLYSETLRHRLHAAGICMRHLGLVRAATTSAELKRLLLIEMLARILKCLLNNKLREAVATNVGIAQEHCRTIASKVICLAVHVGDETKVKKFWSSRAKLTLQVKFQGGLDEREKSAEFDLWSHLAGSDVSKRGLLSRFLSMSGIILSKHALESLHENSESFVVPSDVEMMVPRVKNMIVGNLSSAFSKYMMGLRLATQASPQIAICHRLFSLVFEYIKNSPQISAVFYDRALLPTLGQLFSALPDARDGTDTRSAFTDTVSKILDATISLSVPQTTGAASDARDPAEALASQYVRASRLMRKAGSASNARWMISRARNLGVSNEEVNLESFKVAVRIYFLLTLRLF